MKIKRKSSGLFIKLTAVLFAIGLLAASCGSSGSNEVESAVCTSPVDNVNLQLQWFTQAQFAGYYAAVDQGFYADNCLNVRIIEGGVEIVPATVLSTGGADFAVSWVPRALAPRAEGADVVNIAQVFERSGTLQVSFKDSNINDVDDLRDTKVGNWGFGNESELFAGLRKNDIEPEDDVNLVQQNFDMQALLNGEIDSAMAMIYNEYAQVLETVNPDTGDLYTPDDLNIINWNEEGTAMLQDSIWADASRLESDSAYRDVAVRFVGASLEGWIWCRDNSDECVDVVLDNAPTLGRSHQAWQLNEINGLIWPSSGDIGKMDEDLARQTGEVAVGGQILTRDPGDDWWTDDIVEAALDNLRDRNYDVRGRGWNRANIELLEGGN